MKERGKRIRRSVLIVSCAVIGLLLTAALVLSFLRVPGSGKRELVLSADLHRGEALAYDSRWVGLLTISGHKGEGQLENGTREIRGYLGRDAIGPFFELYNREDDDTARPLLTMSVRVDYKTLRPVIGDHDAVFFYIWLDERDVEALTLTLEDGGFSKRYYYDDGKESCWIEFHVKGEKNS